jgi:hypothetical protein
MRGLIAFVLAAQAAAGDSATIGVDSTLELEVVVRDGSGETIRLLSLARRERFQQEVLEAQDGRPKVVRVKVLGSTLQRGGTDIPLEVKPTKLADRTFVATRGDQGWTAVDAEGGGAAPAEGIALGAWNEWRALVPRREFKAGDQWTLREADVAAFLFPANLREGSGTISCSCESREGDRASILFRGKVTGRGKDDSAVTLTINVGRLILVDGKPSLLSVSGSLESALDVLDVYRKPNENEEERRKVGEVLVRSRKLEVTFEFQ